MIFDQYGRPIPTMMQKEAAEQNTATGYRKIKDDGSERIYEDYDSVTGIKRHLIFRDGKLVAQKQWLRRDFADAIANVNKFKADHYRKHSGAQMVQQTAVPLTTYWKWMEMCGYKNGEYDKKKFDSLINDPDHRAFKTVPGKVSTRRAVWL